MFVTHNSINHQRTLELFGNPRTLKRDNTGFPHQLNDNPFYYDELLSFCVLFYSTDGSRESLNPLSNQQDAIHISHLCINWLSAFNCTTDRNHSRAKFSHIHPGPGGGWRQDSMQQGRLSLYLWAACTEKELSFQLPFVVYKVPIKQEIQVQITSWN